MQRRRETITYWHLELPVHDVVLAEGIAAESYLDTGNRAAFANGGADVMMHADFARGVWDAEACQRLVTAGPELDETKRHLLTRAAELGHVTIDDADLVLVINGIAQPPTRDGAGFTFAIPAGVASGVLVSRRFVPAWMLPGHADHRRLGIAVGTLARDGRAVDLADDLPWAGWYLREPGLRWTDGAATVDLAGCQTLALTVALGGRYWQAGSARAA